VSALGSAGSLVAALEALRGRERQPVLLEAGRALPLSELDELAGRLAGALVRRGVQPRDRVGVLAERTADAVVGILGVLKAGATYVPLDPAYPAERLRFMLEDAGIRLVVGNDGSGLPAVELVPPRADASGAAPKRAPAADDPAYVIYTSGSTGRPKGVVVSHGNVLALLDATLPLFAVGPDDRWALFHSHSFDFSVWELWGGLLTGGTVVVVPQLEAQIPHEVVELVRRARVTVLNQVPSAFRRLVDAWEEEGRPELGLRYLVFGGERVALDDVRRFLDAYEGTPPRVVNMYGITETTVHATFKLLEPADLAPGAVPSPIGLALPHLTVHVLDDHGRPVAPGAVGELWISGSGVAQGYLDRPELTAESFSTLEAAGRRVRAYRSGDLGRVLPGGELEYVGRRDDQLKVRGFRIEPGEIEAALSLHEGVRTAAVTDATDDSGEAALVAYVVPPREPAPTAAELREHCRSLLPRWMVPDDFRLVDQLPVTPSGKLDRRSLREQLAPSSAR
jgi:nonribosomal peptide synthetase DhbF